MYSFEKGVPYVTIALDNGIYVFDCESATGKSYLADRLHLLRGIGEPVDSFSFPDVLKFGDPGTALSGADFSIGELKVILFDRYVQYAGRFTDIINGLKQSCIVLVACNGITGLDVSGRCSIRTTKTRIEVTQGAMCI